MKGTFTNAIKIPSVSVKENFPIVLVDLGQHGETNKVVVQKVQNTIYARVSMSHTEMDIETREVEYGLEQTDLETCPKSVWPPERRERLVSPIGDRLRVTRAREIRKRLTQAERKRKSVTKKAHGERERLVPVQERTLF